MLSPDTSDGNASLVPFSDASLFARAGLPKIPGNRRTFKLNFAFACEFAANLRAIKVSD